MVDGSQVAARVPNPNSDIPHYTADSEVVMIDFACACPNTLLFVMLSYSNCSQVRNNLEILVPNVLA